MPDDPSARTRRPPKHRPLRLSPLYVEVRLLAPARDTIEPFANVVSDVQGRYEFPPLGPGRYRLELWRGRLLHAQEVVLSRTGSAATLDVEAGGVLLHGLLMAGGVGATGGEVHLVSALDRGRSQPTLAVNFAGQRVSLGIPTTHLSAPVGADGGFTLHDAPTGNSWLGYATPSGTTWMPVEIPSERVESAGGFDLAPLLPGVSPELRFGEDGVVSPGRVAPGWYTVALGVSGKRFSKELIARGDPVHLAF